MLDGKTCDCWPDTAAITTNGPVVVYRDRSMMKFVTYYCHRLIDGQWIQPRLLFRSMGNQRMPSDGPRVLAER